MKINTETIKSIAYSERHYKYMMRLNKLIGEAPDEYVLALLAAVILELEEAQNNQSSEVCFGLN